MQPPEPTIKDEGFNPYNLLSPTLDNSFGESSGGSFESESTMGSRKTLKSTITSPESVEEMSIQRYSISSLSETFDSSPMSPESPRTGLLSSSPVQSSLSRKFERWIVRSAKFWGRNRGLCEVFLSQILSALVNTTTRVLETEEQLSPFSVLFLRMGMTMMLGIGCMWLKNISLLGERPLWTLLHLRGVLGFWAIVGFLCEQSLSCLTGFHSI